MESKIAALANSSRYPIQEITYGLRFAMCNVNHPATEEGQSYASSMRFLLFVDKAAPKELTSSGL